MRSATSRSATARTGRRRGRLAGEEDVMATPSASMTVQDGGLGILSPGAEGVTAKVGPCQSGTANTVYSFGDPKTVVDTLGQGPLAEAVCYCLMVGQKT